MVRFRCMVQVRAHHLFVFFLSSCFLSFYLTLHLQAPLPNLPALCSSLSLCLSLSIPPSIATAQDTFDPEFYLDVYEVVLPDGSTRSLRSGRFRDSGVVAPGEVIDHESPRSVMRSRLTLYVR